MNVNQAILATLAYHDIFSYPLSTKELHNYLIEVKITQKILGTHLSRLIRSKIIQEKNGFLTLKNRQETIKTRKLRAKFSETKFKKAKVYARLLGLIPTVYFVGISGALSMGNSTKNDDIDLVIITKDNSLWTTRFLSNVLLFPVKRHPASPETNNRACLNLFISESDLRITNSNLYLAHEICQLKPIWQKNHAYSRFIKANKWIYNHLPNWQPQTIDNQKNRGAFNLSLFEVLLKKFQLFYMKRKISTEQIGEGQLFFHPLNTQERILKEHNKRLKSLKIAKMR